MPHWTQSPYPYFITLENNNKTTYPEIHYLFQDDPEPEPQEDEDTLVIQLDPTGQKIIGTQSLSEDLGVVQYRIKDRDGIKTINLTVSNSVVDADMDVKGNIEGLKELIKKFKQRNEELLQVIKNN
jgi:hypothetical protein